MNIFGVHFAGQLFVDYDENLFPFWLYQYMPGSKWIQDFLYTLMPQQRRCVSLVDELTGKVLWKWTEYELVKHFYVEDFINRDYLLLAHEETNPSNSRVSRSYKCWALPIVIYSPWWARGLGLIVMILVIISLRVRARTS